MFSRCRFVPVAVPFFAVWIDWMLSRLLLYSEPINCTENI